VSTLLRTPLAAALAASVGLLLLGAAGDETDVPGPASGVAATVLPQAARESLALITELTARQCPELPPVWLVAQVEAESAWDPEAVTGSGDTTAAGLLQFGQQTWLAAGGRPWSAGAPAPGDDVVHAEAHLRVAVPWLCTVLRAVGGHLTETGKTADPLDAMLVCHIAGCGRVTGSATGIPQAGEADCGQRCAEVVARYVDTVHEHLDRFSVAPAPAGTGGGEVGVPGGAPAAWTGGATGCELDDPTRDDGCLSGATRHGLEAVSAEFGGWSDGPVIKSAGCWDAHAWNPRSDHPRGRACDLFPTAPGTFAEGGNLDAGWRVADWFREHAAALKVKYLIWQGRYWDPDVEDGGGGWGRRYTGGGVYDVQDATGGHYDHIHVSFEE